MTTVSYCSSTLLEACVVLFANIAVSITALFVAKEVEESPLGSKLARLCVTMASRGSCRLVVKVSFI